MSITIILCIFTFLVSYQAFQNYALMQKLIFHPYTVKRENEWQRFLTHGFVHANQQHLLINLVVLYMVGNSVENFFLHPEVFGPVTGRILYVVLYISCILVGAIPGYIKHNDFSGYRALGASGGTSGLVFAIILIAPWNWFIFPPLPGIILAPLYVIYSQYMAKKGTDNIGPRCPPLGCSLWAFVHAGLLLFFGSTYHRLPHSAFTHESSATRLVKLGKLRLCSGISLKQ